MNVMLNKQLSENQTHYSNSDTVFEKHVRIVNDLVQI